jgi:hypothetical protein
VTPAEAEALLEAVTRSLPDGARRCIRHHVAMGTPLLAGDDAVLWWARGGAASVFWTAGHKEAPEVGVSVVTHVDDLPAGAVGFFRAVQAEVGIDGILPFLLALSEDGARAALSRGVYGQPV